MPTIIATRDPLIDQIANLALLDADFADLPAKFGAPDPHRRAPGFAALAQIVVAQQVSTASALAVWRRLTQSCGTPLTPDAFLAAGAEEWWQAGLTRPKQRYLKSLAEDVTSGAFDPARLATLDDPTAIQAITTRQGFGRWSAEIYLLMALRRPDVFPAGDRALRLGYRVLTKGDTVPSEDQLRERALSWKPYRSTAALWLWHLYLATLPAKSKPRSTPKSKPKSKAKPEPKPLS